MLISALRSSLSRFLRCEKYDALEVNYCACESFLAYECDAVVDSIVLVLLEDSDVDAALLPNLDSLTSADKCVTAGNCGRFEDLNAPDICGDVKGTVAICAGEITTAVILLIGVLSCEKCENVCRVKDYD